jgi:hypothetical protein
MLRPEFNVALNSRDFKLYLGGINDDIKQRLPLKYKIIVLDNYNQMFDTQSARMETSLHSSY